MPKPRIKFFCFKTKKSFETDSYGLVKKGNRCFAIAEHEGSKCYRIVDREFYNQWSKK